MSDAVHIFRSLYKLLSSYRDRRIQNTVKYLRRSILQKKIIIIIMPRYNQKFFREKEGGLLWNEGTSINILLKTPEKEAHRETFWSPFS